MTDEIINKVGKRLRDLHDLPIELRNELQDTGPDELSIQILKVMKESFEGVANLDEILVGLYRATKKVHKRTFMTTKVYKMAKEGLIEPVQNRKGIYRLKE